jgi:hypothetical protein
MNDTIGDEPFVMLDIFYPVREEFLEKLEELPEAGQGCRD